MRSSIWNVTSWTKYRCIRMRSGFQAVITNLYLSQAILEPNSLLWSGITSIHELHLLDHIPIHLTCLPICGHQVINKLHQCSWRRDLEWWHYPRRSSAWTEDWICCLGITQANLHQRTPHSQPMMCLNRLLFRKMKCCSEGISQHSSSQGKGDYLGPCILSALPIWVEQYEVCRREGHYGERNPGKIELSETASTVSYSAIIDSHGDLYPRSPPMRTITGWYYYYGEKAAYFDTKSVVSVFFPMVRQSRTLEIRNRVIALSRPIFTPDFELAAGHAGGHRDPCAHFMSILHIIAVILSDW